MGFGLHFQSRVVLKCQIVRAVSGGIWRMAKLHDVNSVGESVGFIPMTKQSQLTRATARVLRDSNSAG